MKITFNLLLITFLSVSLFAENSEEKSFPGLVSTEVFNMGNGMEMHIERRKTCDQGTVPKHFHPAAGTLVYVLDGLSQSKSSGNGKLIVIMSIGLKNLIGFMVVSQMHLN